MEQKTLWIATSNVHKIEEFHQLLPNYEIKSLLDLENLPTIVEDGKTFEQNAMIKAKTLANLINGPAIGDDSGIMVEALDGFPGVYSARWAAPIFDDEKINEKLLEKMQGITNRNAVLETVIAYYNPKTKTEKYFSGQIKGTITMEPRGERVFGYNQIFQPENSEFTFSELGEEKNKFSHRQIALKKFINYYQGSENFESEN